MPAFKSRLFILLCLTALACSSSYEQEAHIIGRFSIADSLDDSGDFSQIKFQILFPDTASVDTLLTAMTDKDGRFAEDVQFPKLGRYITQVRRYGNLIASSSLLLGHGDTVRISAELPGYNKTVEVNSKEEEVLRTYARVQRGFNRIFAYVRAGQIPADTLPDVTMQWSELYWELYQQEKPHYGAKLAAAESARLLSIANDSLMLIRLVELSKEPMLVRANSVLGKQAISKYYGLDSALNYIHSLEAITDDQIDRAYLVQEQVDLLADSLHYGRALKLLNQRSAEFGQIKEFRLWASDLEKDFTEFTPGTVLSPIELSVEGTTFALSEKLGKTTLVEIAGLANSMYQNQLATVQGWYLVYKRFGFEVITLPLDESQVAVNAFFDERGRNWTVADAGTVQQNDVLEKWNVYQVPTRFLLDEQGRIIGKYVGDKMDLLFNALNNHLQKQNPS